MSGNVRLGSASSAASRGSASTSASAARSPPSTRPPKRCRRRHQHRAAVVGGALVARRCAGCPPAGEALLRPAAGRGPALQVRPVGRRTEHHARRAPPRPSARRRGPARSRARRGRPGAAAAPPAAPGRRSPSARTAPPARPRCRRRRAPSPPPSVSMPARPALRPANRFTQPSRRSAAHLDGDPRRRPTGARCTARCPRRSRSAAVAGHSPDPASHNCPVNPASVRAEARPGRRSARRRSR